MRNNIGLYRGMPKYLGDIRFSRPDVIKDDGFIYGSLVVADGKYFICTYAVCSHKTFVDNTRATMFEVIPETVGEFTGISDKNNKKIFEGDIIKSGERVLRVHFNGETLTWELTDVEVPDNEINHMKNTFELGEIQIEACYGELISEIIGNIHRDPELLNGGGNNDT